MSISIKSVRRRSVVERRVLQILRGNAVCADGAPVPAMGGGRREVVDILDAHDMIQFERLRDFARRNGLDIQPATAAYLTSDELQILRWLAEAQREVGLRSLRVTDIDLMISIMQCAAIIKKMGLFLPPQTLSIGLVSSAYSAMKGSAPKRQAEYESTAAVLAPRYPGSGPICSTSER